MIIKGPRDEAPYYLRGLVENVLIKANDREVERELVGDIGSMAEIAIPTKAAKEAALCPDYGVR